MPPTSPPIIGRPFHCASVTVSPKPSRIDFCMQTSACDWKALTSIAPTLLRLLRILMSGSPSACRKVLVEELPALGVVGRHRADQRQLGVGHLLGDDPVGVDHPDRVLPGVEARDLADQRPVGVDPELLADEGRVLGRERHVLRRQRVDRRRADPAQRRRRARPGRTAPCARRSRRSPVISGSIRRRASRGSGSRGRCGSARSSAARARRRSSSARPAADRGR